MIKFATYAGNTNRAGELVRGWDGDDSDDYIVWEFDDVVGIDNYIEAIEEHGDRSRYQMRLLDSMKEEMEFNL